MNKFTQHQGRVGGGRLFAQDNFGFNIARAKKFCGHHFPIEVCGSDQDSQFQQARLVPVKLGQFLAAQATTQGVEVHQRAALFTVGGAHHLHRFAPQPTVRTYASNRSQSDRS
ncbi:hypothetical protein BEN49_21390 [Hymenobacter coccineus]|uniref:Uncharacterized protein n=1 Tax=Hymenobacter coccineus TaxID=1908235 RepID=A0A1G1TJH2_9BACT|nr:hypothetical protein BEN49_21390 [Hymenobacter coccineus]